MRRSSKKPDIACSNEPNIDVKENPTLSVDSPQSLMNADGGRERSRTSDLYSVNEQKKTQTE